MRSLHYALLASLLLPAAANAVAIVDQSAPTGVARANVGASNIVDWSQTFTAGLTGTLDSVGLWLSRESVVTQPLLFDLRTTSAGAPTEPDAGANILASVSIPASDITSTPTFYVIDLSGFHVSVSSGEVLAIALRSDDPGTTDGGSSYYWSGNDPGAYAPGGSYLRVSSGSWGLQTADRGFTTFVQAPEPAAPFLLTTFLAAAAVKRRRP